MFLRLFDKNALCLERYGLFHFPDGKPPGFLNPTTEEKVKVYIILIWKERKSIWTRTFMQNSHSVMHEDTTTTH